MTHEGRNDGVGRPVNALNPQNPDLGAAEDGRSAVRHRLVYRVAKLISANTELLCIVRNVSADGISIEIFGEFDLPMDMEIELAGGAKTAIRKVWQRNRSAGFQFRAPVEVEDFLDPPQTYQDKRAIRLCVNERVIIKNAKQFERVLLVDISVRGAKIEALDGLEVGHDVDIVIPDLGAHKSNVRWRDDGLAGVLFYQPVRFDRLAMWSARIAAEGRLSDIG